MFRKKRRSFLPYLYLTGIFLLYCKFLILIMRKKKKLKTGKNLLVLSKDLLVIIARTCDSLRFSVSQKVFNTSKFWLILIKNFLDLGMEFVYEKITRYQIVSPRKSLFSMIIFSTLKQSLQQTYRQLFISIR